MDEVKTEKENGNKVPEIDEKMVYGILKMIETGKMDRETLAPILWEFFEMKARVKRIEDALTAPGKHVLERSDVYYHTARLLR